MRGERDTLTGTIPLPSPGGGRARKGSARTTPGAARLPELGDLWCDENEEQEDHTPPLDLP